MKKDSWRMSVMLAVFCLAYALVLTGCGGSGSPANQPPIETIRAWGSDGFFQIRTNDPRYHGWTLWHFFANANQNPDIFEIDVKKMSGAQSRGFGMSFGAEDPYNTYALHINVLGDFAIARRLSGTYSTIQAWMPSNWLYTGFGVLNTIRVTRSGSTFRVYFNGQNAAEFTDSYITGGNMIGFRVSIGTSDQVFFPNTPVDVRFRQTSP